MSKTEAIKARLALTAQADAAAREGNADLQRELLAQRDAIKVTGHTARRESLNPEADRTERRARYRDKRMNS